MSGRKLGNWVDTWTDYTSPLPSPDLWKKWAGIFILGASLERRVWVRTSIGNLYPNLYLVLVGPPGTGKTLMTSRVRSFLSSLTTEGNQNSFHIAAASETHASIIDSLRDASRRYISPNMEAMNYNSLTIVSNELGVLLPEYEPTMMNKLTDIYDGHPYSERRRTKELNFIIPEPQINLIAATTPSFLVGTLPEGAWDQGFLARTLLAFSSETLTRDLFTETKTSEVAEQHLIEDLQHIYQLSGKMAFAPEAAEALENWNRNGRLPLPDHPKLLHYNTRRAAHLIKLCMIASIATSDELTVTLEDFQLALDWLVELEVFMPEIFKAMTAGGDSRAMEDVWYQVAILYTKENQKPISEARIVAFLAERLPAQNVARVLDVMIKTGIFIEEFVDGVGKYYRPRSRKIN